MSPPPAGAPSAAPDQSGQPRGRQTAPRTTGRAELSRNPRFAELSPEVGELDREALDAALAEDPDETLTLVVEMAKATDERLRAEVRRLAPRIILDQTRRGLPRDRGVARRRTVPADRGGDLDLDRSMEGILEARAARRAPHLADLRASDWASAELALCLLVDSSGSMNGERLTTAAVAAAACLLRAPRQHALVAFASQARVLKPLRANVAAGRSVEQVLRLRGHGTTGIAGALTTAGRELASTRARRRVTVLLSDCRVTDEVDPVPAARRLDELVILAPAGDDDEARALARDTGARVASIGSVLDVPAALARLLGDDRR